MPRPTRPTSGLWNHQDFMKLWTGQSISEFGSQISALAIPWFAAVSLHASPFEFSLLGVLAFLPFILFALPAGVWVDRLRRRPLLIVGDAGRAALLAYIPIAWFGGWLEMYQLLALSFAIGVLTVLFDVAYQSYLPSLVERDELVEGNSKLQTTASAANVTGPPIAGLLISAITAPYAIVVDAISFVVSTLFMLRIRKPETHQATPTESSPRPKMWPELKEGLRFVTHHPHLKWIAVCTGTGNFFGTIAFAIGLLFMQRTLHLDSFWVGFIFAGYGVGSIIGAVTATRYQRLVGGVGRAIWTTSLLFSVGGFAFPLAHRGYAIPLLLAGTLVIGFGGMVYNIAQVSYRQAICPPRLQGRMNATMRWIVWGTVPLGGLLGGALGQWASLRTALWVGAIGGVVSFLPVLLTSVREIKEIPAPVDEPTMMEADGAGGLVEPTTPLAGAAAADA